MSKSSNLKRSLKDLTPEEKLNKIKEIALKEELARWRYWGLKAVRDKELGNFEPSGAVKRKAEELI